VELSEWRGRGREADHRGQPIFYVDEGQGPVVVAIHGFPTASYDWSEIWPELVSRHRVIAPDLIGFGFSAKPRGYPYSILDQADLVEGLLAGLGIAAAHVLSHDYGDTVAQELLARDLDRRAAGGEGLRLGSVCLLNGGLFPETHRPVLIQRALLGPLGGLIARLANKRAFVRSFSSVFGPDTQPTDQQLERFWALVSGDGGLRIGHRLIRYIPERVAYRDRWVGALQRTASRVRLVNGVLDPVSGAHMVARYRELISAPDVVELSGVGHYPQVEAPAETARAITEFFGTMEGT
jgi:pimeloyl-ACP methyl ester carboxylesterase